MIPIPRQEHKLLLAIHGWSGVLLGLLLLIIVATGTVAVMGDEIGIWSAGSLAARSPLTRQVDATVKRLLPTVPLALRERLDLSASRANRLNVLMRGAPGPNERGVSFELTSHGTILHRFEGYTRDVAVADPASALSNFLIGVHVRLYVPEPWGYILTGVAGLAMLVAAISGFFIHRHLLTDIFTLRRSARAVLAQRDRHSVAGAWALPFVFVLALTGSFLSFAGSVGFPALSWVSFGGDQQKLIETLIGMPAATDPSPTVGADLDGIIADATTRAGIEPEYVEIAHPGRADARVTVTHETRDGDLTPTTLVFDGVSGRFLADKPGIGRVPSIGGTVFSLMAPLHFGDFAGLASKFVWVTLGFTTCFLIVSGTRLWLCRRDLTRPTWSALDRATSAVAFGLPFAMGTASIGFFASLSVGTTVYWTAVGFITGAMFAILSAVVMPRPMLDPLLRACAGASLYVLPILRLGGGGPSWIGAYHDGQSMIIMGDVVVVLIGLAFSAPLLRAGLRPRRDARALDFLGVRQE